MIDFRFAYLFPKAKLTVVFFITLFCSWFCCGNIEYPNVLFIAVDDLRPELGCYGQTHIKSPNIDQLAAEGILFNRAYCQQSSCNPSRASLLTGLRPDTIGVHDLVTHFRKKVPDVVTLPQQFKNHGYFTQPLGKIFHGSFQYVTVGRKLDDLPSWSATPWLGSPRYYFTEEGVEIAREDFAQATGKSGIELDSWTEAFVQALPTEAPDVPDNVLYDGEMTDLAIRTLYALKEKRSLDRPSEPAPFFLAVGYQKPHLPFIAPKKYWDLYDPNEIKLADNPFPPEDAPAVGLHSWGELRGYTNIPKEGPLSTDQARRLLHGYYACVSFLDAQIGRLLNELDRLDLRKNTIVVFWGDHGWHLGEHDLWGKTSNFEHDTRSPLIISLPGKEKAGRSTDALVEFVDIYPSLCELAGLPLPPHLEGTSFVPLIDNPEKPWKRAAFSQYPRSNLMGYSMRTNRYRITAWQDRKDPGRIEEVELYDHQTDPGENINIAARAENAAIVNELVHKLGLGWRAALPGT